MPDNIIRKSKYFFMTKEVSRPPAGRGAKFQWHKTSYYVISSKMDECDSAWSPNDNEVDHLMKHAIKYKEDKWSRTQWKFRKIHDAEKAWLVLLLKYTN